MTAYDTTGAAASLWPIVVTQSRHSGCTDGQWVAIPNADRAPLGEGVWGDGALGSDWAATQLAAGRLGVGASLQQAYDDLLRRRYAAHTEAVELATHLQARLQDAGELVTLEELAHELDVRLECLRQAEAERSGD